MNMEIDECVYKVHPIYNLYAANENGYIITLVRKIPMKGTKSGNGYLSVVVRRYRERNHKTMQAHRLIWECHNGMIPEGMVIDHINNVKDDNRLSNLQLLTQQENCKKSAKNRDYSFASKNHQTENVL